MQILQTQPEDLKTLQYLYEAAIAYQKTVFDKHWLGFEEERILAEIEAEQQWKIVENNEITCVFLVTQNDEAFWKEKAQIPAIYLHRIAVHPHHRGKSYFKSILTWAETYAKSLNKNLIRLDTWGDNEKLIQYYQKHKFQHIATIRIEASSCFPQHYKGLLALLEYPIL